MKLSGWGRYPAIDCNAQSFELAATAASLLKEGHPWIAHGAGKSYGDSALNHHVLLTRRFNKLLNFDSSNGIVRCESGVTLAELIDIFLPRGWFLKVTPGTKLITVGGAIASDVHGKNHHADGCFSSSVIAFRLMLPDGSILDCSRRRNPELFHATCGGMGLTGLILDVDLQFKPVTSALISERIIACRNLDTVFELFEAYSHMPYSVAWIDCFAIGDALGRSLLMIGRHAEGGPLPPPPSKQLSIPLECPAFMLNTHTISLFNRLYYHLKGASSLEHDVPFDSFFYPLDQIANWNRIYGKNGFTQYQFVLPRSESPEGLRSILKTIAARGMGSFLAVLKLLGPENENLLSFPMEGYTLALDFKIEPCLFSLLDELDRMVLDCGGRLYLAKDVRMSSEMFTRGYPDWKAFHDLRRQYGLIDAFNSLQSERLGI